MQFKVPDSPEVYTLTLGDFLGVDFTSILPSQRRSSNLINMINNNGYLETRPGYDVIGDAFGTAASITTNFGNANANVICTSIRKSEDSNDITVTFVKPTVADSALSITETGTDIVISLKTDSNNAIASTASQIAALTSSLVTFSLVGDGTGTVAVFTKANLTGGVSRQINGIWNIDTDGTNGFIIHVEDELYILDDSFENSTLLIDELNDAISQAAYLNNKLIIYDGKRTIVYGEFANVWECKYLDEIGYIPTTMIGAAPDGTGGTAYEEINNIQPYRINSFLPDGASATFKLDSAYDDEEPTVTILQSDGTIATATVLSYDNDAATVTLSSVPPVSPVDGRDSIFVNFKVTNTEIQSYVNKCTIVTTYGYDSNDNRLFITGNSDFPNIDWFSEAEDPTYFPAANYTQVGFAPIINYLRLNDGSLSILKDISDTDSTVYYRTSAMYNNKEVFPIAGGVKTIGCISKYANANLMNDPLTLTNTGIFGIVGSDYKEKFAQERSYFVRSKLLEETNLNNATSIVFKGKYYLAVNNHVYVADSRYASKVKDSSSDYQYEWYYWENVPVRIWFTYNNELYFCNKDGDIVKFDDESVYDYNIPINQLSDTSFLSLGSISLAKTIKRVSVVSRPFDDIAYTLSYITSEATEEITTKDFSSGTFPSILQEKEKIKKQMFIKFRISSSEPKKMNFYQIAIEYILAGHYRGE